jgi:hypothetical protein
MAMAAKLEFNRGTADLRSSARRRLRLTVEASIHEGRTNAIVHDLSYTGFLLEVQADLHPGDELQMDLPEAGGRSATIIWRSNQFFGCEFNEPISSAAFSATLLKAVPQARFSSVRELTVSQGEDATRPLPIATKLRTWVALALAAWTIPAAALYLWI